MADNEYGRYNFHMGVHYMDMFMDDAETKDVIEALRVLSEFFVYNKLDDSVDFDRQILASKAVDVAYAALVYPLCNNDGLNIQDCADELRCELDYWV